MLALMSPKLWAAVILAAVLGFTHFTVYRAGRAAVRTQWDAQKLSDEQKARTEETRRQALIDKETSDAQAHIAQLETDLAGARAGSDRLRAAVRSAVNASKNPGASIGGKGKPDTDPLDVLAVVLSRSDDAAGRLSEYADRLRIAGIACERAYTGLQPAP
jgi:hypothetical protein